MMREEQAVGGEKGFIDFNAPIVHKIDGRLRNYPKGVEAKGIGLSLTGCRYTFTAHVSELAGGQQ